MLIDINFSCGKINQPPNKQTKRRQREVVMMNLMKRMILMR
ncbi:hypothetical protein F383_28232 [Gossypium arboreum]|uniref:Uncharacterized protein n=1 Tax=Gossypium arboreum TaxID=29729 RepID=A0A0B0P7W8_GOSAR|nr:hypothetical protein F383_28232 [Gossypium arboreum]